MKISEDIRNGIGKIKQKRVDVLKMDDNELYGCVIGCALVGKFGVEKCKNIVKYNNTDGFLYRLFKDNYFPESSKYLANSTIDKLYKMNDFEELTFEEIATKMEQEGL